MSVTRNNSLTGIQLAQGLIARLSTPDGAAPLVEIAVDYVLDQPLTTFVEPEIICDQLLAALKNPGSSQHVQNETVHLYETERKRVETSGETLGDYIPETVRAGVEARLGRPPRLPDGWADGILDPDLVRELLANIVADSIEDFLARIPMAGGAGGLIGSLTRGIGRFKPTGTAGVITEQIKAFATQSAELVRQRLADRLQAPEYAAPLSAMRHRALERILALQTSHVMEMLDDPGIDVATDWTVQTLIHNLDRKDIRASVEFQIAELMSRAPGNNVRGLLEEFGILAPARARIVKVTVEHTNRFAQNEAFMLWLSDTLTEMVNTASTEP